MTLSLLLYCPVKLRADDWYVPFYNAIPFNLQESYCKCDEPRVTSYRELRGVLPVGTTWEEDLHRNARGIGSYCSGCNLPNLYTLYFVIRSCEVCGNYYVPEPAKWTYPIKSFLCAKHHIVSRREVMLRKKLESEV